MSSDRQSKHGMSTIEVKKTVRLFRVLSLADGNMRVTAEYSGATIPGVTARLALAAWMERLLNSWIGIGVDEEES